VDDDDPAEYWKQQSRLPLRQRDRVWWAEVGFSNAVAAVVAVAVVVLVALGLLGVL
jgi:type IV secretory pathway component VirB8